MGKMDDQEILMLLLVKKLNIFSFHTFMLLTSVLVPLTVCNSPPSLRAGGKK